MVEAFGSVWVASWRSGQLWRYDVVGKYADAAPALDLNQCPRPSVCPPAAAYINQPHSSDDDLVHSASVQTADFRRIGCVTYQSATGRFRYFATPAGFIFDECHIDKSGDWLVILETRSDGSRRNRIVDLIRGSRITTIEDFNGRSAISTWGLDTLSAPTRSTLCRMPPSCSHSPS